MSRNYYPNEDARVVVNALYDIEETLGEIRDALRALAVALVKR